MSRSEGKRMSNQKISRLFAKHKVNKNRRITRRLRHAQNAAVRKTVAASTWDNDVLPCLNDFGEDLFFCGKQCFLPKHTQGHYCPTVKLTQDNVFFDGRVFGSFSYHEEVDAKTRRKRLGK